MNSGDMILKDIHGSNATLGNMVRIFRNNQSPYSSHNKQGIFFWTSLSRKIGIMSPESGLFSEVMSIRDSCLNRLGKVDLSKKSMQNCTGRCDDLRKFDVAVLF